MMTKMDATSHTQQETMTASSNFNFGFTITDLYRRSGLVKLDQIFLDFLRTGDETLYKNLEHARAHPMVCCLKTNPLID